MLNDILTVPDNKVVDFVDGSFRNDTPEENVRQNIAKRLVNSLKYPKARIEVEFGIKIGSTKGRADLAIFKADREKIQENIEIIIECKKESVSPADKKEGVNQMKSYMACSLNCEWGLWTNGKHREVWRKTLDKQGKPIFVEEVDIPHASGIKAVGRKRIGLDPAVGDVLLFAFKTCHNHIHAVDGYQKEKAFFELLKIIFCKITDEKNIPHDLDFFVKTTELNDPDGQIACKKRISKIFDVVKAKFPQIFAADDAVNLNPRSLVRIVAELQNYSLLSTNIDIKGKAYEEIVGSNLKGDRGQFFTPRNVMNMAVEMLNPKIDERVLDPACGTGGFLVTAMLQQLKNLEQDFSSSVGKEFSDWSISQRRQFDDKVAEIVGNNFFGFDITPELVKASKMNMVMNNDGSGNMLQTDSLLPPYMWSEEFRVALATAINSSEKSVRKHIVGKNLSSPKELELFDVIITNPPFGSKIEIKDSAVLSQFDLAHIWERPKTNGGAWVKTDRLQSGVPPEQLFVERCVQFLKPGGRMAIVLPDSILGSPGLEYIRFWLFQNVKIIASLDMHEDAFQPHTGVQTSILILQKFAKDESQQSQGNYNVFMAIIDKVGHDKRGNTVYKKDERGNEILADIKEIYIDEKGRKTEGVRKEKVVDDQTIYVPAQFNEWKQDEAIDW